MGSSSPSSPPEDAAPQEEVESILLERSKWWDIPTLCLRVFRSHQFKNIHVEYLYQKYFMRMNQSNLTSLLGLLTFVVLIIPLLSFVLKSQHTLVQNIMLGIFALIYLLMEIILVRSLLHNEVYFCIFAYIILGSFFGLEALVVFSTEPKTASAGVWATLFFIYMTYTFLPLRIPEATIGGILLGVTQLGCAAAASDDRMYVGKQVSFIFIFYLKASEPK